MDELDKMKKKYEMNLALNGDEISKEIESMLPDDIELMKEKARCYFFFKYISKNRDDLELYEKCKKYLDHFRYYENILRNSM